MIPARRVFDKLADDYDRWFDEHGDTYRAQIRLLRNAVPPVGHGLEVGIGSGRFAVPLGIRDGIDPSPALLHIAKTRNIEVVQGEGEHLPYRNETFDYVLMMTVLCFLDNPPEVVRETFRVLAPGGDLILGFIEKDGEIALHYQKEKVKGRFLRFAGFRTVDEVARYVEDAGFSEIFVARRTRGFCVMKGRKTLP
jgi:ubiquinone/menaquinone biosynthesis C-methylase UbiE